MRQARDLLASLLACACLPAAAHAAQSARLHVVFTPERLGRATTVEFGIQIAAAAHSVPPPLTALDVHYPENLGVAVSGLGLATCSQARLEALGPEGCPADSRMGQGSALAEIPIGPEIVRETAAVTIVRAPANDGRLALLFYANAVTPVNEQIVFPGQLFSAPGRGGLHINVPLVPSLPGGPNVAIVGLHATLGPRGLTYYEHVRDKLISYHPNDILLPDHCPRGGFPFAASLTFEDGSHANTHTTVPCPATVISSSSTYAHRGGRGDTRTHTTSGLQAGASPIPRKIRASMVLACGTLAQIRVPIKCHSSEKKPRLPGLFLHGSDGTRTRGLRRDRPAL